MKFNCLIYLFMTCKRENNNWRENQVLIVLV